MVHLRRFNISQSNSFMKCLNIRKWPERQQTKLEIIKLIIYCMLNYKESRVCCGHVQKNYKEKELVIIAEFEFHKKKTSNAQIDFDN